MRYVTFSKLERVGRLGNQAIQCAATIGLALKHGHEPRFPPGWSYRPYFSLPHAFFSGPTSDIEAWELVTHMDKRTVMYLQDLSLFADVADEVRRYFQPSPQASLALADRLARRSGRPVLCIHVRRGDNVQNQDYYPLPSLRYYLEAIEMHPECDVEVFSDDFAWVSEVLEPRARELAKHHVFVHKGIPRPKENASDYWTAPLYDWIDLLTMASIGPKGSFCLSNSTLGYFAAFLAGSEDVSYPSRWYGPKLDHRHPGGYVDASLLFPKSWTMRDS